MSTLRKKILKKNCKKKFVKKNLCFKLLKVEGRKLTEKRLIIILLLLL